MNLACGSFFRQLSLFWWRLTPPPPPSSRRRTIALLVGIGGLGLATTGFLFLRSIRRQMTARSTPTSSSAIVLHSQPSALAPPRQSQPPASAPIALPQGNPTVSALPGEELPVQPVLPPPPLTIHYPNEKDPAVPTPLPPGVEPPSGEPINLVDLMDIRKRRPHS
ncbi:MAG: hypothetical protein ACO31I_05210 [Prochlorotrichaceae cyanobacterium]